MKIPRVLLIGIALLVGAFVASSTQAASIVGSAHDLSSRGWGTDQICIFCHAPHNTQSSTIAPLWNHGTTAATFTLYSSTTFNGAATITQPTGNSKACLSCHDGTVALDTYGSRTGTNMVTGSALVGTNLSNDHPVSFTYDAALATADGGLVSPASASLVVAGIPLYGAKLECASCHAVHDPQYGNFLRASNAASALCMKCHNK